MRRPVELERQVPAGDEADGADSTLEVGDLPSPQRPVVRARSTPRQEPAAVVGGEDDQGVGPEPGIPDGGGDVAHAVVKGPGHGGVGDTWAKGRLEVRWVEVLLRSLEWGVRVVPRQVQEHSLGRGAAAPAAAPPVRRPLRGRKVLDDLDGSIGVQVRTIGPILPPRWSPVAPEVDGAPVGPARAVRLGPVVLAALEEPDVGVEPPAGRQVADGSRPAVPLAHHRGHPAL